MRVKVTTKTTMLMAVLVSRHEGEATCCKSMEPGVMDNILRQLVDLQ